VILPELHIYWVWRLGFGVLILSGAVVGFYNIWRSLYGSAPVEDEQ
jgi:cytochrome c oxidase cbb3-type subunit I